MSRTEESQAMNRFLVIGATGAGMSRFRGRLLEDLVHAGFQVWAVADYDNELDRRRVCERGAQPVSAPLSRASINPLHDLAYMARLLLLMLKLRPDHVLLYTIKPVIYGGIACRLLGVRRYYGLVTGTGTAFAPSSSVGKRFLLRLVVFLYRTALRRAGRVFFQNRDDRGLFVRLEIVPASSTVVVPGSGVDLDEFRFAEPTVHQNIRFLFVGRYLRDKGFLDFLGAAARLKSVHQEAEFFLAGRLDERSGHDERVALDLAVARQEVRDLGFVEDVGVWLRGCDVLVLPSYGEGMPRAVLEAMSTGRPVITTDAPGCRDTVVSGESGLVIDVGNIDELVKAMTFFIENPASAARMGRAARHAAESRFAVEHVNRQMMSGMGLG